MEIKVKKNVYIILGILLISCNNQTPQILWEKARADRSGDNMKECITSLELIIDNFPHHGLAPKAQYLKAEIYLNDIKDYDFAVKEFKKVISIYPDKDEAKNALFMLAYIYNNYLGSYTDAINNYNMFINRYPGDELVPSVQYELDGLIEIQNSIDSLNALVSKINNLP